MALAYQCDRCGKYCLQEYRGINRIEIKSYDMIRGVSSTYTSHDLCPECKDEMYKFLKIKEKEKENESSCD